RFLNPERVSMPDFDIDFCYERRQEVIDYVVQKYGADHTAQIITFGKMKAKAVTRDVGRALGMAYGDVDRIAKMIPSDLGTTLTKALAMSPELKAAYDTEPTTQELIDMCLRLEGLPRHASTHAAGVVIADKPVYEYVPLNTNDGLVTTQFPMGTVEELGLLKMDFLGLRTLTVIRLAIEEIKRSKGVDIDPYVWDYEDPKVYEMISQGKTGGVFQIESSGMTSFMKELQPENIEDLTAGISLYRPGPMDFIPQYIKGKRNPANISYMHKSLEPILKATYGCIVYQEQVMQIVRDLAGFSLGRSDLIRRAMGKKQMDVMAQERKNFIHGIPDQNVPGCIANGIPEAAGNKIFDAMMAFAAYAFNKSHGAAYSFITYQTAWLRYYYPVEFMAALMTSVIDASDKVSGYIRECKKMGINMLPPDVNEGYPAFSVTGSSIRFGLCGIKNVGRSVINALVAEREKNGKFKGISDFIKRMSGSDMNKRCIESLIRAGAFDSLGGKRSQYVAVFANIIDGQAHAKKSTLQGQLSLFDMDESPVEEDLSDNLPDIGEFPKRLLLFDEKELMGMYVSGHPLAEYEEGLSRYSDLTSLDFSDEESEDVTTLDNHMVDSVYSGADANKKGSVAKISDGQTVKYGGMITGKKVLYTKADNKAFCFLTVEDMYGAVEVAVFSKMYEKFGARLQTDQVIVVQGKVSMREDEATKINSQDILFYEDVAYETGGAYKSAAAAPPVKQLQTFWIKVPKAQPVQLKDITDILTAHHGQTQVMIYNEAQGKKYQAKQEFWVTPNHILMQELERLLGDGTVKVV
ncbi:MAG: DNA polymerase III subunit alpha, partial [Defluviitaleaceae bacterium]|nr:DNA polymerase III subunit alpha [Defluviitaleaceae bacterium]